MYVRKNVECKETSLRKTKRRLLRAASNQITSASKLKRSMELNISVRRVQQVLQAAPYLRYRKMRAVPWMTERHFANRVDWVKITSAGILSGEM